MELVLLRPGMCRGKPKAWSFPIFRTAQKETPGLVSFVLLTLARSPTSQLSLVPQRTRLFTNAELFYSRA